MLVIRLARFGAKKRPFYHINVADSRRARDGRFVEKLGYFAPLAKGEEVRLKVDMTRIDHWISCGAHPSETVHNLIKELKRKDQGGILMGSDKKISSRPRKKTQEVQVEDEDSTEGATSEKSATAREAVKAADEDSAAAQESVKAADEDSAAAQEAVKAADEDSAGAQESAETANENSAAAQESTETANEDSAEIPSTNSSQNVEEKEKE